MSDALAGFDPAALEPIARSLMQRLPALSRHDGDLHALLRTTVAADGSVFTVPADVLWAVALTRSNGRVVEHRERQRTLERARKRAAKQVG